MDSLASKTNPKAIRETLANLPKTVEDTYDEAMHRIGQQNYDHQLLAHNVLMWIANARRPLTVLELQYALSVEINATTIDEECLEVEDVFLSTCAGIVICDEGSKTVRLVRKWCTLISIFVDQTNDRQMKQHRSIIRALKL
jgi:hypothetical protein